MLEHFTSVDLYGAAVHEKDGQRKNKADIESDSESKKRGLSLPDIR